MSSRITQQELESYLWGAATLLRGTIDAGDYKQFIFPLLFYKRLCDVFDEETQSALKESGGDKAFAAYRENHRFQLPQDANWREVRQIAKNVGHALQKSMRAIETANPDKLYGIFGDAQWTNKDRLSDAMLRNLVEHFSALDLSVANLAEDELGQGYEYLIKKFADDSGHTAAEFYTNRTVVHLMTEMLQPEPGESIYDPTCGSGGMLLSCITHLRRQGKEWRNVHLYGQERNLMTSSIARMNCFLHGIEDFQIIRGDTLSEPKFVRGDRLMQFDVVLANPPYSIKQWDRDAFASDPWGRNLFGTPPQGRADYAFWQHIICSLRPKTGRCAILFPHGVLFRQEEADMRRKLIEADLVECVIGLGPNLFYNSPMEACVVVCRAAKPKTRRGKILLINAVDEVTRERAQSFLTENHMRRIVATYEDFKDVPDFARVVSLDEVRRQGGSLNIALFVTSQSAINSNRNDGATIKESVCTWLECGSAIRKALAKLAGMELPCKSSALDVDAPSWLRKSDWKRLPFGAFADSVNERVEPADAADETYLGLDDLDPQDLHIRRWGQGSDVIGTKLRFRKGDVIFGRRRAYQRKLVIAEIDGICSAHAMVVRAKPELVLPEFLPFFMTSDRFMGRAVEISVGSLSPTINWSTLKLEEFYVPPLDQQRRIAEVLWAIDRYRTSLRSAMDSLRQLHEGFTDERFANGNAPRIKLGDLSSCGELDIQTGPFGTVLKASSYVKAGTPIINPVNMRRHHLWVEEGPFLNEMECERLSRYKMRPGDILLGRKGDVGRAVLVTQEYDGYIVGSDLIRLRLVNSRIRPEYLYYFMLAPITRQWISRRASGTTMPGINEKLLNSMEMSVPLASEQLRTVREMEDIVSGEEMLSEHTATLNELVQTLINALASHS